MSIMKVGLRELLIRARQFFISDQWVTDLESLSIYRRTIGRWSRMYTLTVHKYLRDKCMLRSAALTLVMIFSLAPALAVGFSVAKGFGVQERVRVIILERVQAYSGTPAEGEESDMVAVASRVLDYVQETNVEALGIVGFVIMLYAAYSVLSSIERTFNEIWGVTQSRSWTRQAVDYVAVMFVVPLTLTAAALTQAVVASAAKGELGWLFRAAGPVVVFTLVALGLSFLYAFFPNTRVPFRSAIVGGIVAAIAWSVLQYGFVMLQVGVAKYNKIYGTFAAVPIFLLWLYTSWQVILLGAELSYARTHESDYAFGGIAFELTPAVSEDVAVGLATVVAQSYQKEEPPPEIESLSRKLQCPVYALQDVVQQLVAARVLVEVNGDTGGLQPAAPLDHITVRRVLDAVRKPAAARSMEGRLNAIGLEKVVSMHGDQDASWEKVTLMDLVHEAAKT